jgi:hypothetical protein
MNRAISFLFRTPKGEKKLQGQRVAIARRRDFNGLVNARLVPVAVPKNSELAHNTWPAPQFPASHK